MLHTTGPRWVQPEVVVTSSPLRSLLVPCSALCLALLVAAGCTSAKTTTPAEEPADVAADTGAVDTGAGADDSAVADVPEDLALGTDAAEEDVDQSITDATLLDISKDCKKQCLTTAGNPKICGPDNCGSVCGFCPSGKFCKDGVACIDFCQKTCTSPNGKPMACGDDGCGGQCGLCDAKFHCGFDFLCHPDDCVPSCTGKVCGDDGCGKNCGTCANTEFCTDEGQCQQSACAGVDAKGECSGDLLITCDGAGATAKKITKDCSVQAPLGLLTCGFDIKSQIYGCITKTCKPSCTLPDGSPKKCGDDGCGKPCGACPTGWGCPAGTCQPKQGAACGSLVTEQGTCDGNKLVYCQNGTIQILDCQTLTCQWNSGTSSNVCL